MSKKSVKSFFLFLSTAMIQSLLLAQTQDKGVGTEEVIVVKEFEAKIPDADKITLLPNVPQEEPKKVRMTYTLPDRDYKAMIFEANPLKPLSLSKEKLEKYNSSFIKIGFGSQLMPIAQLAYNDNKSKNIKFGFFYDHLSAHEYKKIKFQRFSDDEAGAYLKYIPKKVETGLQFTFRNYRTHFYGLSADTTLLDSTVKAKDVRQVFRTYDAQVYFKNIQENKLLLNYKQSFRFSYLQETFGKANEWFISGETRLDRPFLKYHSAGLDFDFDVSNLKNDSLTLRRMIFTVMPGYSFNNDNWKAYGKIGVAFNNKQVVLATDVYVEKGLYRHTFIAFLGYKHGVIKNSLLTLSNTNNFIHNWVDVRNSVSGDFYTGVKGAVENFTYLASFHLKHVRQLPLFVTDTLDIKRFQVAYDSNALIYNVHFEAGYNVKEWLKLAATGDYNIYQLKNELKPWHEPNLRINFRTTYIWKEKILVSLDLFGITNSYARLSGDAQYKIKGIADLNISAEYLLSKHISFWAMLNNIANQKYERWKNYPSYGINGAIGAKFSF